MQRASSSGDRHLSTKSEPGAPAGSARRRHRLAIPLLIVGCGFALGLVVRDPNVLLLLLVILGVAFLLHLLAARLTEFDLLIPFIIGVGCLAVVLWWFAPESFYLSRQFDERAPAPVKRVLAPVGAFLSGSGAVPDGGGGAGHAAGAPPSGTSTGKSRAPLPANAPGPGVAQLGGGRTSGRAAATVTLTAARSTTRLGEPVTVTVFVHSLNENGGPACGRVNVFDGSSRIATAVLTAEKNGCTAVLTVGSLRVGTHNLTARHGGAGASPSLSSPATVTVLPR